MKIAYVSKSFGASSLAIIEQADAICREYAAQGYDLTLRQLYYQFVARGFIPNRDTEYKRLGGIINDARLAGLIDWNHLTDRTRNVRGGDVRFMTEGDYIRSLADSYSLPLWDESRVRIEVWVEKEALAGIVQRAAGGYRVEHFSCRGYVSQSEMWGAAQRLERKLDDGVTERIVILHLGDHDPSGIDMTRDIRDRLGLFLGGDGFDPGAVTIRRIALNIDQVQQYNPPPNPAKLTDSRVGGYLARFGNESWELDALDPDTLRQLIESHIQSELADEGYESTWSDKLADQRKRRAAMVKVASQWPAIVEQFGQE